MHFMRKNMAFMLLFMGQVICEACTEGCLSCPNSRDKCDSNYVLDGNKCLICDSHCTSCENRPTYCTSCENHYFLDNNKCSKCSVNCEICIMMHHL